MDGRHLKKEGYVFEYLFMPAVKEAYMGVYAHNPSKSQN
jgi:hypothetical protein